MLRKTLIQLVNVIEFRYHGRLFLNLDCSNRILVFCTVIFRDIAKSFAFIELPPA